MNLKLDFSILVQLLLSTTSFTRQLIIKNILKKSVQQKVTVIYML